jgi:tRNA(Ile)-lysidine synthase
MCNAPQAARIDPADAATAWFDADRLAPPLAIRNFRPGDRMRPRGLPGHRKIKKILGDCKIPRTHRLKIPLLVCAGHILWLAGIRRSSHAAPDERTVRLLKVAMRKPFESHQVCPGPLGPGVAENPG